MPKGKGTYGDQVGRPSKKDKSKGMPYAPFKMMGHELPGPNQKLSTIDNLDVDKKGSNTDLIEALKKEDEVKSEVENLKQSKDTNISSGINI